MTCRDQPHNFSGWINVYRENNTLFSTSSDSLRLSYIPAATGPDGNLTIDSLGDLVPRASSDSISFLCRFDGMFCYVSFVGFHILSLQILRYVLLCVKCLFRNVCFVFLLFMCTSCLFVCLLLVCFCLICFPLGRYDITL